MITAIRDLRRAKGLTLAQVAARCEPATTAQTIGRLETGTRLPPEFPITLSAARVPDAKPARPRLNHDHGLERRAQRIAERYAPAYVITDEQFQVLNFSGRTGRYLEPTSGIASSTEAEAAGRCTASAWW